MFRGAIGGPIGLVFVLTLSWPATTAGDDLRRFEYTETHMGSPFHIVLYSPTEAAASRASRAAFQRIAALDACFSDYQPDSELSRLSAQSGGPATRVSDDLFDILLRSRTMADASAGAFDVTVGPVVRLWRRARRDGKLPEPETLSRARALVDYRLLELDPVARTVRLRRKGMKLDLGGIAKGYASDAAVHALRAGGIDRSLVAGAGDVVAGGPPPGRDGWTIGIAPLENPGSSPERFLLLRDAAVSTSGDAERFVEIDGKRYSHIVDPRTGLGVVDRSSVTVVARDGPTADALATAVYALGPDRGLALVDATQGASALIVRAGAAGRQSLESRAFSALPKPQSEHARDPSARVSPE